MILSWVWRVHPRHYSFWHLFAAFWLRYVWTVTDGKYSSSVTRSASTALGAPSQLALFPWTPEYQVGGGSSKYVRVAWIHFVCEWFSVAFFNNTNVDQNPGKHTPKNHSNSLCNFSVFMVFWWNVLWTREFLEGSFFFFFSSLEWCLLYQESDLWYSHTDLEQPNCT